MTEPISKTSGHHENHLDEILQNGLPFIRIINERKWLLSN